VKKGLFLGKNAAFGAKKGAFFAFCSYYSVNSIKIHVIE
jgi:hypothetical protein